MKLTYDPEAKAVYIYLTEEFDTIADHTQELTNEVSVDWMKDGTLYGIEVLCVKREPTVEGMSKQIELRAGAENIIDYIRTDETPDEWAKRIVGNIFQYLHYQGVRIVAIPLPGESLEGCCLAKLEPLIEEKE